MKSFSQYALERMFSRTKSRNLSDYAEVGMIHLCIAINEKGGLLNLNIHEELNLLLLDLVKEPALIISLSLYMASDDFEQKNF